MPAEAGWIVQRRAADLTSRSLRKMRWEEHACRARGSGMDNQTFRGGPDKRVPPTNGRDERVPSRSFDESQFGRRHF